MENVTGRESLRNLDQAVLEGALRIDAERVDQHLGELVRQSVEQTLNGLLEAEADQLCGAQRYERSVERLDTRAGHYERQLGTTAGEVTLKVPRL
jgi:transposase-like protein